MKRILIILFSIFYLSLCIGIPITIHFCRGNIEKISIYSNKNLNCCCSKSQINTSCCNNKNIFISAKIDEQYIKIKTASIIFDVTEFLLKDTKFFEIQNNYNNPLYKSKSPPKYLPKYIFNCSLIFYG
jgi:hypothetical protein